MLNAYDEGLALDLLQKFIGEHTGKYRVIDMEGDIETEMSLAEVWDFHDGQEGDACRVISEMLTVTEGNRVLKSNGWIVKKLH